MKGPAEYRSGWSLAREASKEQRNVVAGASELVVMTREIFFPNDSDASNRRPADRISTEDSQLTSQAGHTTLHHHFVSQPIRGSFASGVWFRGVTLARARRFRSRESSDA